MHRLLASLRDFALPPICLGCDALIAPARPERLVCRDCRDRLGPPPAAGCPRCGAPELLTGRRPGPVCHDCADWPASLRSARSACVMRPPADRLVHQLKYRGWRVLAGPMAERMAAVAFPVDVVEECRLVIPVPTTRRRLRERGYNQAALLAAELARRSGRRVAAALVRAGAATTQTVLQPAARGANVAGSFVVDPGFRGAIHRAHVLLVDDVLTTGATAAECTRTLVAAGARAVSLLTFARALGVRGHPDIPPAEP